MGSCNYKTRPAWCKIKSKRQGDSEEMNQKTMLERKVEKIIHYLSAF